MKQFIAALFFISTTVFAQQAPPSNRMPPMRMPPDELPDRGPETCSAATLRGDYVFAQDGTVNGKPLAAAGRETYDGNGHVKGVSTVSVNGVIKRGAYTATYTMKADCSGTLTITDADKTIHRYDVFTVPSGDEATWIETNPGSVSAGWQRRRPNRPPMPPR